MIYPCNLILEDYLFSNISKTTRGEQIKYYLTNLSRLCVLMFATYVAIELQKKLDLFLSILGAVLCAPIAITLPALLNLKVMS